MGKHKQSKQKTNSKMHDPAPVRAASPEPSAHRTGTPAVKFRGHFVEAEHIPHVTRPAAANAGSHDHLVRGDGSEDKGHSEHASEQAWTPSSRKSGKGEY